MLKHQLEAQRKAVSEFEEAIAEIKNPPKYPSPTPSEPLAFLKLSMQEAVDESDRKQRLKQAEAALSHAKKVLLDLEAEYADIQDAAAAGRSELGTVAAEINLLSEQLAGKAEKLLQLARQHHQAIAAEAGAADFNLLYGSDVLCKLPIVEVEENRITVRHRSAKGRSSNSPFAPAY